MRALDKSAAIAAIRVLAGKGFENGFHPDKKDAVLEIVGATREESRDKVATVAIGLLLELFDKSCTDIFANNDSLVLAINVAETYPPSPRMATRVVRTAARAGYIGRFPYLPQLLLGRPPSPEEITLLITNYVEDTGCRGESTEKKLKRLAQAHMPSGEAAVQIGRIEKFVEDWDKHLD